MSYTNDQRLKEAMTQALGNANGNFDGWGTDAIAREFNEIYDTLERITESQKDEISISWCVDDVLSVRAHLTTEQARAVLERVDSKHDATIGVTWETLELWADELYPQTTGE